jgi:hypothetical protein
MPTFSYPYQMAYSDLGQLGHIPALQVGIQTINGDASPIDIDAYLDSGAMFSLFDGAVLSALNLNVLDGRLRLVSPIRGPAVETRVLPVRLLHEHLGNFDLEIGFSTSQISRNLLGRDFFDRVQIAFREHHLTFYINPTP